MNFLILLYDYAIMYWKRFIVKALIASIFVLLNIRFQSTVIGIENITDIVGVLFGFSISTLAILISNDNENIGLSQEHIIKHSSKQYSLYYKIITGLSFTLVIEGLTLMSMLAIPGLLRCDYDKLIFSSIMLGCSIFCVLMLTSIVLELFLIITKHSAKSKA